MKPLVIISLLLATAAAAEPAKTAKQRSFEAKVDQVSRQKREAAARQRARTGASPQCRGAAGSPLFPACF